MKTCSAYRQEARQALSGKWGESVAASVLIALFFIVMLTPSIIAEAATSAEPSSLIGIPMLMSLVLIVLLVPMFFGYMNAFWHKAKGDDTTAVNDMSRSWEKNFGAAWGFFLLKELVKLAVSIGLFVIFIIILVFFGAIGIVPFTDILNYYSSSYISDAAMIGILIVIFLYLLFYIACVIANVIIDYIYGMTYYIKADHPDKAIIDCMIESRRLMRGKKWNLFVLDLTFIGWMLLSILTLGIGLLWLAPYICTAHACFYKDIITKSEEPTLEEPNTDKPAIITETTEETI